MNNETINIQTEDCEITILNNAPPGFEQVKSIAFRFNDQKYVKLLN